MGLKLFWNVKPLAYMLGTCPSAPEHDTSLEGRHKGINPLYTEIIQTTDNDFSKGAVLC